MNTHQIYRHTKNIFCALLLVAMGSSAQWKWTIDASNSSINFSVQHLMISEVTGSFTDFSGTVESILDDFSDMRITVIIKANSITTGNASRDAHLRGPDFFDAGNYGDIVFKSTRVAVKGNQQYSVTGDLTMRGRTLPVTLDVSLKGRAKSDQGEVVAFRATTEIDRTQWGLQWNRRLESGGLLVGNSVDLTFNIELRKGR